MAYQQISTVIRLGDVAYYMHWPPLVSMILLCSYELRLVVGGSTQPARTHPHTTHPAICQEVLVLNRHLSVNSQDCFASVDRFSITHHVLVVLVIALH